MSTTAPPVESKSAKKRRAKTETIVPVATNGRDSPNNDSKANGTSGQDGAADNHESPYLKELSKNIRNVTKKLNLGSKADTIVKENPGVSLDDLVAQKKLNADQKAQVLKKPQLQEQLAQLEEQQKHYHIVVQELEEKYNKQKAALVESHDQALAQAREDASQSATSSQSVRLEQGLKTVTGFLHAAAAKRQSEDTESEEARAFEGALLLIYQGNSSSYNTLKNLVEGSQDKVPDTENNPLEYTFAQIKDAALANLAALSDDTDLNDTGATSVDAASTVEPTSDPTIANAGLTELEDTHTISSEPKNGGVTEQLTIPEQASITADAANAVAEANWDSSAPGQTPTGDDWVQVPRDPAETDTGNIQPAAQQSTANWADEAGDAAAEQKAVAAENDGFEQVRRDRGGRGRGPRGRGYDGRGRGRGRGEGHRGRGGQGRGRGGPPRGDRGQGGPAPAPAPAPAS